ncbi:MAG: rhomboid family intramembrane serine protease [Propionibacteriales bacterium]|nr:rhomboid family intramembrane serine protease [Propionibacteriales bacterium]
MSQPPVAAACYRHPDRPTYIACQRCGRPICGDCMISAAVGFQCPDCVREGARQTRQNELPFGGLRVANSAITSITLIAINAAVWVLILLTGGQGSRWVQTLALTGQGYCGSASDPNSYYPRVSSAAACVTSADGVWIPGALDGGWWQVVTSGFTHVQPIHIGLNMLALWFIGPSLERILGRTRFLAIYLLSLLAGSAAVLWLSPGAQSTLGASGAIFGLIGALLVLTIRTKGDLRNVLVWLGINLVATFYISGISWQAHLGGLVGGLIASAIIMFAPRQNRTAHQVAGLVALGLAIAVALVVRAFVG